MKSLHLKPQIVNGNDKTYLLRQQFLIGAMRALLNILDPVLRKAAGANQLVLALVALSRPSLKLYRALFSNFDVLLGFFDFFSFILDSLQLLKIERAIKNSLDLVMDPVGSLVEVLNTFVVNQFSIAFLLLVQMCFDSGSHFIWIDFQRNWTVIGWHLLICVAHLRQIFV